MYWVEEYKKWCESKTIDENLKFELEKIKDNLDEIKDRFYKNLEFGTAGLRGKMGVGTNRMNKYTVAKATQGLAKYLLSKGKKVKEKGVVIAFDSRKSSKEFAEITALCLNAHEIKTYIFEDIRPTPELSFAIRELECEAGVVITASHNPPEYNGYKVYQNTGEQIIEPVDEEITKEIEKIKNISEIKVMELQAAKNKNLYNVIGKNIDDKYIEKLKELILNKKEINNFGKKIKIVYTPLHGTGKMLTERILKEAGFENIYIVKEQENPDGDFPTVKNPNPEKIEAFKLALELAKEVDADIILANDPDADRLGMCVKNPKTEEYIYFTGNMSAMFIAEYQFSQKKKQEKLPVNGILMTSIVSSDMSKAIANEYGLEFLEVLTGFKNIGASIEQMEKNNKNFVFGFEESNGCLIGDYVRDKDGVAAALAVCEAATFYMSQGITVWEQMINLYEKYGYYKESQISISFENSDNSIVNKYMKFFRESELKNIGKYKVIAKRDYLKDEISYVDGEKIKGNFPKSNIIYYELEKGAWVCIRPSGTEPKIKAYVGVKENSMEEAEKQTYMLERAVRDLLK